MTGSTSGSGDKSSSWISGSIPTSGPGSGQINIPQSGLFGGVRPGTPVQARERHPASSFAVVALFAFVGLVVAIRVFGRDRGADVANALRVIDNVVDASR